MSPAQGKHAGLRRRALEHHEFPTPGKVAITANKQLVNQRSALCCWGWPPVHILTPSATVRRIVNMTALTVADANASR